MRRERHQARVRRVSVLFNEPKLLKSSGTAAHLVVRQRFSALQRAEIAEINDLAFRRPIDVEFQCSSTSRNC